MMTLCPHCDMGIVPTRSKLPWTHKFRKCQHCHGDWRNYVKKPEPQPDVHPTNHMDALPPMEEHMVSQFNALSQKESDAYNEMMGTKFINPDKEKAAREYNQLMDLTLTYRQQDVYIVPCPSCYGVNVRDLLQDPRCKLCRDCGYVKVAYIKPAP